MPSESWIRILSGFNYSGKPIYEQIKEQIKEAILSDELNGGLL